MILLSFDIEEFDTPGEYGVEIPIEEQMELSVEGTKNILSLLKQEEIKATFFCTANFALRAPEIIKSILEDGHEVASHGYYHSSFKAEDLKTSKEILEKMTGKEIEGFRMARMMPVSDTEIKNAGYSYNSSLNPTFLPGRYYNLDKPRTWFYKEGLLQIPASVTPLTRIPLFWLAFHNFPSGIYKWLTSRTLKKDGYLNVYFHPWEFINLYEMEKLNLPFIITNNSGDKMVKRLGSFIQYYKKKGYPFGTIQSFIQTTIKNE